MSLNPHNFNPDIKDKTDSYHLAAQSGTTMNLSISFYIDEQSQSNTGEGLGGSIS